MITNGLIFLVAQVNDILRERGQMDLVLTAEDEDIMKAVISLLSSFKNESVQMEQEGPTIQFVYLSYLRLKDACAPKVSDCAMMEKLRSTLSMELGQKYSPHIRHLLGLFFWPKFRKLLRLSSDDRARVGFRFAVNVNACL